MTNYDFIEKARKVCKSVCIVGGMSIITLSAASQIYEHKYNIKREESISLYYRNTQKMEETKKESHRYMRMSDLLLLGAATSAIISFAGFIGQNTLENRLRNRD